MIMEYEVLKLNIKDGIAIVTISRPKVLNALNSKFFREMNHLVADIKSRNDVTVMIITGEGKTFAAGADIKEMVDMDEAEGIEFSKTGQNTFNSLELLDIPVIAAVNGFALGGGCELSMACDFRIASSRAKFGHPEVNLGLIPGWAATQRLPRLVGLGNALYLLLTGDMITAEEALRVGLVQKVVEPEQLMPEVMEIAQKIASRGPKSIRLLKQVTRKGLLSDFDTGCLIETRGYVSLLGNEGAEGMRAFLEKRDPKW